jgi:hypothetical protein
VGDKDSIIELSDEDAEFQTPPPAKSTYGSLLCFRKGG